MKTIGLVGGTGWISSVDYYRIINQEINHSLGGLQFAKCILYSFNYGEIDELNKRNDQESVYLMVRAAALDLMKIGADCIVLCANTLHLFADRLEEEISVPLVHIATATAKTIKNQNMSRIGLLGTKYTMEEDFYRKRLTQADIHVLVPPANEREFIHNTIMNELLKEIIKKETKDRFLKIIKDLQDQGAEGIVLGCTEIPLLIQGKGCSIACF